MNIFVVDHNPVIAAHMLCDQHVVKMVTESVQMLSTCHRVLDGKKEIAPSNSGKRNVPRYRLDDGRNNILYHAVHFNHPCNIWIRDDIVNYDWLVKHTYALCEEYTLRYNKKHACESILEYMIGVGAPKNIPNYNPRRPQQFVQAMPDEYKDADPVKAYRNFYVGSKSKFARWKFVQPPQWYIDATRKPLRSVPALRSNQESLSY